MSAGSTLAKRIDRRFGRPAARALRRAGFALGAVAERPDKVFCVGLQRSGTTSFGDFCEQTLKLPRRGYATSNDLGWSRAWMAGEQESVFASVEFRTGVAFDDSPWWFPGAAAHLAERFPQARFAMFTRDPMRWFRSMQAHSGGRSPGGTAIHAKVYGREEEWRALQASGRPMAEIAMNGLSLEGCEAHYVAFYERYLAQTRAFFAATAPERFFEADLEDPDKFRKLAVFLGFPDRAYPEVRANVIASAGREGGRG